MAALRVSQLQDVITFAVPIPRGCRESAKPHEPKAAGLKSDRKPKERNRFLLTKRSIWLLAPCWGVRNARLSGSASRGLGCGGLRAQDSGILDFQGVRGMGCTRVVKGGCANYTCIDTAESREDEEMRCKCPSKINPQQFNTPRTIGPRNPSLSRNPHHPEIFLAGGLNYKP